MATRQRRRTPRASGLFNPYIRMNPLVGPNISRSPFAEVTRNQWKQGATPRRLREPIVSERHPDLIGPYRTNRLNQNLQEYRIMALDPTAVTSNMARMRSGFPEITTSVWPPTPGPGPQVSNRFYLKNIITALEGVQTFKEQPVDSNFFQYGKLPNPLYLLQHRRNALEDFYENISMDSNLQKTFAKGINKANNILYPWTEEQQHLRHFNPQQVRRMVAQQDQFLNQRIRQPDLSLQHLTRAHQQGNAPPTDAELARLEGQRQRDWLDEVDQRRAAFDPHDPSIRFRGFYQPPE